MLRGSRAVQLNAVPWGNHYSGFFLPQVIWSVLEFHINGIPLYVVSCVFSFTWQNVFDIQPCCVFRCLFLLLSSVPLWGSIPVYLSTLLWKDIWVIFRKLWHVMVLSSTVTRLHLHFDATLPGLTVYQGWQVQFLSLSALEITCNKWHLTESPVPHKNL
jgi:hypothetical protein